MSNLEISVDNFWAERSLLQQIVDGSPKLRQLRIDEAFGDDDVGQG